MIQTWIVGIGDEQADHLTTTAAQIISLCKLRHIALKKDHHNSNQIFSFLLITSKLLWMVQAKSTGTILWGYLMLCKVSYHEYFEYNYNNEVFNRSFVKKLNHFGQAPAVEHRLIVLSSSSCFKWSRIFLFFLCETRMAQSRDERNENGPISQESQPNLETSETRIAQSRKNLSPISRRVKREWPNLETS